MMKTRDSASAGAAPSETRAAAARRMRIEPPVHERLKPAAKLAEIPEGLVNREGALGGRRLASSFRGARQREPRIQPNCTRVWIPGSGRGRPRNDALHSGNAPRTDEAA